MAGKIGKKKKGMSVALVNARAGAQVSDGFVLILQLAVVVTMWIIVRKTWERVYGVKGFT